MLGDPALAGTFLAALSDHELSALRAAGHDRQWQSGEALVRRGDPADSAIALLSGRAKIHILAPPGVEVILGFSGAGDLLGEISAVRRSTRAATVTALEPTAGVIIAIPAFRTFLASRPAALLALLDLTLERLHVADIRRIEFATADSLARVAARLVELAERFGVPGSESAIEITLPISQDELASWSASSRESTGRALRALRDQHLIETGRRQLTVLDLDGLRDRAARI